MSYRGYQQGGGGGGGGTPYRSNLMQNLNQRNMVSPWECGVAPNSRGQIQNVLPLSQSPTNVNMLAQQHALAVASNLLSTLGMLPQPQQQHQQPQELPSLLNLSGLGNNSLQFRHQPQNYGHASLNNRYSGNMGNVRRKQEQGNYRAEPYNKQNRGGRQQSSGQHHQQGRGRYPQFSKNQGDRKPAVAAVRASDKPPASSKGLSDLRLKLQKPDNEQGDDDAAENGNDETESKDPDTQSKSAEIKVGDTQLISDIPVEEDAKRDDEDDTSVKKKNKRDWKDEKKVDVTKLNNDEADGTNSLAADDVAANSAAKSSVEKTKPVAENDKKEQKNSEKTFQCHVCNRSAQGELAFVRHMNSKQHKIAMETLSEQYKIEADNMRRNMQTDVRLEELNFEKQKRMGKMGRTNFNRDYCKMCDLHFYGNLPSHRRNEKHLKLKTFLHPRCRICDKEFPTRLEWDNHRLSILHQLRVDVKGEKTPKDVSLDGIKSVLETSVQDKEQELNESTDQVVGDLEMEYDPTHCYGLEVTIPGFHCKVCEVFFQKKREHCKTKVHFSNWLQYKAKEKEAADIAEKSIEAEVLAQQQSVTTNTEEATSDAVPVKKDPDGLSAVQDDEGNWKRRRVETAEEEEDDESEVIALSPVKKKVLLVNIEDTPTNVADGNAPYDPLEADLEAESQTESLKDVPETEDTILEELDDAISEILDSANKVDQEVDVPVKGMRARRGGRGGGARGRKRK